MLGDGTGARVSPILDDNGNLDRIDIVDGGENYSEDSLSLQLLQVRRVVRTGTPAEITTRWWTMEALGARGNHRTLFTGTGG